MPGYWQEAPGQGYQRISGYWMPDHLQETTYLPQPPNSVDTGPTSPAPDANGFWVPGTWQWRDDRYVWQPGYWVAYQPDWIWVPATYSWTPRGWVYVPGYWDYPLARRGLVFSPVYFARPVAVYQPAICVDAGVFGVSLFARPAYGHYYFGDYYDDHYVALGIRPWFYYNSPRVGYDPLFGYYRWYHVSRLGERQWDVNLVGWHDYYRVHAEMRPPHTWAAQQVLLASREGQMRPDFAQLRLVGDVHVVARLPGVSVRLGVVSEGERAHIQMAARENVPLRGGTPANGARWDGRCPRPRTREPGGDAQLPPAQPAGRLPCPRRRAAPGRRPLSLPAGPMPRPASPTPAIRGEKAARAAVVPNRKPQPQVPLSPRERAGVRGRHEKRGAAEFSWYP